MVFRVSMRGAKEVFTLAFEVDWSKSLRAFETLARISSWLSFLSFFLYTRNSCSRSGYLRRKD
jgi:hypothetical protein